jgi:LysR family transcriptional activator of nhaA
MKITLNGKQIWINYNHLYYFYEVVNEGGLANASKLLLLGQPTLSSQIRQFEQTIGFDLFDRTHKKLTLTPIGKITHDYAKKIFEMGEDMMRTIHQFSNNQQEIKIGIFDEISSTFMMEICRDFVADPKKNVVISRGNSLELIKLFNAKKLDLLFSNFIPSDLEAPGAIVSKVEKSPFIFCSSPKYKNLIKDFPASLDQAPFIMPLSGSKSRNELDSFFKKNHLKVSSIGESKDVCMQRLLTLDGMCLMAAPLSLVQKYIEKNELIEIGRPDKMVEELYLLATPAMAAQLEIKNQEPVAI